MLDFGDSNRLRPLSTVIVASGEQAHRETEAPVRVPQGRGKEQCHAAPLQEGAVTGSAGEALQEGMSLTRCPVASLSVIWLQPLKWPCLYPRSHEQKQMQT